MEKQEKYLKKIVEQSPLLDLRPNGERKASANSVDIDQTPQNVACDQDPHCSALRFLDTAKGSQMDSFKFNPCHTE